MGKSSNTSKKQQEEKCQSGPAKAGSSRTKATKKASSASSDNAETTPAPPPKFSEDTERLQKINRTKKSPVGAQIKRVIDLLLKKRQCLTPEEIFEACYVDINGNQTIFDNLNKNPKVNYDGECFSYKPKHDIKDENELLIFIQKLPEGIAVTELEDAYPNVMKDLQALKAAGKIWMLSNLKLQFAYPNDPKMPMKVDDELKQLFQKVELPQDFLDIETYLQKNQMKPATDTAKRRAMAYLDSIASNPKPKKKEREISSRIKLTNAHLPDLFFKK